ncbi:hypothetical protein F5B18DRAFT_442376 [Nemania serpens]|nr:hypothetical protein F5B18DRAFT_442376 [Nemania serpens]
MATPQSTTAGDAPKNNLEQITFRFCSECSNMLYPKEDEDSHRLMFTCRTCQYTEEATSSCVFRHVLNSAAGETAGVTQDVGSDPTQNPDFAVDRCVHHVQLANYWTAMDEEARESLVDRFSACGGLVIPHLSEESISQYLPFDMALDDPEADPPEALGMEPSFYDLPRSNQTCPACQHDEAVFFQSQQRSAETGMKLFYVCCECGHIFQ